MKYKAHIAMTQTQSREYKGVMLDCMPASKACKSTSAQAYYTAFLRIDTFRYSQVKVSISTVKPSCLIYTQTLIQQG